MSELISKEQAMAYPLSYEHYDKVHGSKKFINGVESYREYIDGLPTVEERRHGHWIWSDWFYRKGNKVPCRQVNCSVCNGFMDVYEGQKAKMFCGDCGAIMDEVSDDE